MVSNRTPLREGDCTDARKDRLFTSLHLMLTMCQELIATVGNDTDALEDYISRFENTRPPHAEAQAISILLDPNTRAIFVDSIVSGCLAKLGQERSKFINFDEYVWWRFQELKLSAERRARAVARILDLHADHGLTMQ